jgi:hypothetical protein
MEQGSRQGQQSNDAQQNECGSRRQEFIERVSCVHRRIRHRGAGSRQDARNIRRGQAGKSRQSFAAARPFADTDQSQGEQCTQFDSDTRTDEALLDRVTHEKYATEREGNAADPDDPTRTQPLFKADRRRQRRCGKHGRLRDGRRWRQRQRWQWWRKRSLYRGRDRWRRGREGSRCLWRHRLTRHEACFQRLHS